MSRRGAIGIVLAIAVDLIGCRGGTSSIPATGLPQAFAPSARDAAPAKNVRLAILIPLPSTVAGLSGIVFGQGYHSDPLTSFDANTGPRGGCAATATARRCIVSAYVPSHAKLDLVVTTYDRYPFAGTSAKELGTATVVLMTPKKGMQRISFVTSGAVAGARIVLGTTALHSFDSGRFYATVSALDAKRNVLIVSRYLTARGKPYAIRMLQSKLPKGVLVFKPGSFKKPPHDDVLVTYVAAKAPAQTVLDGAVVPIEARAARTGRATLTILKPAVTEAALSNPGSQPGAIAVGPDDALWFCEYATGKVGRVTTAMQVTGEYGAFAHPQSIASAGGALWIAENDGAGNVDRIATDGSYTSYPLATNTYPNGISAGSGGNLWFGSNVFDYVSTISTSGTYGATYALPDASSYPDHSVLGPDGNQYFTLNGTGQVAQISPSGTILASFSEPGSPHSPEDVVAGPDGRLWFSDTVQSTIYAMTTGGVFTAFPISAAVGVSGPLAFGPDGKLWFAAASGVGRLDTKAGTATSIALVSFGDPFGIALGPDGAFYVTEFGTGQISRLQ